jgi:hypothetical protein
LQGAGLPSSTFFIDLQLILKLSEAKSTHQTLKELLKTHVPWDKEVEFQRKRYYLPQNPFFVKSPD